ncbi:MAG: endonuclease domain-containing protein, partial [Planctomycetota bacterium]
MARGYDARTLRNARCLRADATPAEQKLWSLLRGRNLCRHKFRRQQPIGPFVVDFVCQERRLILEADGDHHAHSRDDARRDAWLCKRGYRVMRFWNYEILENTNGVLRDIMKTLESAPPSPTATRQHVAKSSYPLPPGERRR